jgi:hypothetical protein
MRRHGEEGHEEGNQSRVHLLEQTL